MLATFRFNLSSGVRVVRSPLIAIHLDFQLMENLQVGTLLREMAPRSAVVYTHLHTHVQLLPRFFPLLFTPVSFFVCDVTFLVEYDHRLIRLIRTGGRGPCGMYANVLLAHAPYNDTPFIGRLRSCRECFEYDPNRPVPASSALTPACTTSDAPRCPLGKGPIDSVNGT